MPPSIKGYWGREVSDIYPPPQEGARPTRDGALHCPLSIYNPGITLKTLINAQILITLQLERDVALSSGKKRYWFISKVKQWKQNDSQQMSKCWLWICGVIRTFELLFLKSQEAKLFLTATPCTISITAQSIMIPISLCLMTQRVWKRQFCRNINRRNPLPLLPVPNRTYYSFP